GFRSWWQYHQKNGKILLVFPMTASHQTAHPALVRAACRFASKPLLTPCQSDMVIDCSIPGSAGTTLTHVFPGTNPAGSPLSTGMIRPFLFCHWTCRAFPFWIK